MEQSDPGAGMVEARTVENSVEGGRRERKELFFSCSFHVSLMGPLQDSISKATPSLV